MKNILFLVGVGVMLYGVNIWMGAETIMQQQAAIGLFIVAAVLVSGGAVVDAVDSLKRASSPQEAEKPARVVEPARAV